MCSYHQVKINMKKILIKMYMQKVCHKNDYLQYTFIFYKQLSYLALRLDFTKKISNS